MAPSLRSLVKTTLFDRIPGLVRRGPTTAPRVALTFDDGPDHLTERYLALLDSLGVPATFFVCGNRLEQHPDLAREYVRHGHQVASHGYDHQRFPRLSRPELLEQCARTDRALGGGQPTGRSWVRPPHGALDAGNVLTLLAAGYTVALWSLDSRDHSDQNVDSLVARCARATAGEVILFHEGQPWTLAALPHVVSALAARGLECATMHDLLAG